MGEEKEKEVFKRAEHAWGGGGGMERVPGVLVGSVACVWRCQSANPPKQQIIVKKPPGRIEQPPGRLK